MDLEISVWPAGRGNLALVCDSTVVLYLYSLRQLSTSIYLKLRAPLKRGRRQCTLPPLPPPWRRRRSQAPLPLRLVVLVFAFTAQSKARVAGSNPLCPAPFLAFSMAARVATRAPAGRYDTRCGSGRINTAAPLPTPPPSPHPLPNRFSFKILHPAALGGAGRGRRCG